MNIPESIRVAIADIDPVYMHNLSEHIRSWKGFELTLSTDNGYELLQAITTTSHPPHICLLDINLPGMNGYDTLVQLKKKWPFIKALVFTSYTHELCIREMIQNGTGGYLKKGCDLQEVKNALTAIYHTGYYYSELLSIDRLKALQDNKQAPALLSNIPAREMEFLQYCIMDLHYKEIATRMHISENTVKTYRDNLFERFHVTSKTALVVFAMRTGLVSFNEPARCKHYAYKQEYYQVVY